MKYKKCIVSVLYFVVCFTKTFAKCEIRKVYIWPNEVCQPTVCSVKWDAWKLLHAGNVEWEKELWFPFYVNVSLWKLEKERIEVLNRACMDPGQIKKVRLSNIAAGGKGLESLMVPWKSEEGGFGQWAKRGWVLGTQTGYHLTTPIPHTCNSSTKGGPNFSYTLYC